MNPEEARAQTKEHINRVGELIGEVIHELGERAAGHDASKLESPEVEMFAEVTKQLKGLTYGSPEYEAQRQSMLGIALGHHYEHNRHHPEHFESGILEMNLVDLMELFCDWKAAGERHADGNIFKSIEINQKRFDMSPQLARIFENTARLFGTSKEEEIDG